MTPAPAPNPPILAELLELGAAELSAEDAAALARQLADADVPAPPPEDLILDQRLRAAMPAVPVPDGLKGRVLDAVGRARGRGHRRLAAQVITATAAGLLAVALAVNWKTLFRPTVDAVAVAERGPDGGQSVYDFAKEQLKGDGLDFRPVPDFDPQLCRGFDRAELLGRTVPVLHFVDPRSGHIASVYVVRAGRFDLSEDGPRAVAMSGLSVRILDDRDEPRRIKYVVKYSGPSIEPFLRSGTPA